MSSDNLSDSRINVDVEGNVERKLQGLWLHREVILSCANCKTQLATVIVVKENLQEKKVRAECPKCGDHSFVVKVMGQIYVAPAAQLILSDCYDENGLTILKLIEKKR